MCGMGILSFLSFPQDSFFNLYKGSIFIFNYVFRRVTESGFRCSFCSSSFSPPLAAGSDTSPGALIASAGINGWRLPGRGLGAPHIAKSALNFSLINNHSHFSGAARSSFLISSYSLESRKKILLLSPHQPFCCW